MFSDFGGHPVTLSSAIPYDHDPLKRPTVLVAAVHVLVAVLHWLVLAVTIVHDFGRGKNR